MEEIEELIDVRDKFFFFIEHQLNMEYFQWYLGKKWPKIYILYFKNEHEMIKKILQLSYLLFGFTI